MDGCFFLVWLQWGKILDESLLHTTIALKVYWQWKQWPSAKEGLKKSALRSGIELALIQQKTSKNSWNVVYPSNIRETFNLEMTCKNGRLKFPSEICQNLTIDCTKHLTTATPHNTINQRDQIDISPNKMPINLLQNASNFIFLITKVETVFFF